MEHEPECMGGLIDVKIRDPYKCKVCHIIIYLRSLNETNFFRDTVALYRSNLNELENALKSGDTVRMAELTVRARKLTALLGNLYIAGIMIHHMGSHPEFDMKNGPCCPSSK